MKFHITKKPQKPIIINGFPGFGLVGTIATEYLVQHLNCEFIGKYWSEKLPATIAVHDEKVVHPLGIFYNEEYNIIIIHAITSSAGIEWDISDLIIEMGDELNAHEIINLEGVGTTTMKDDGPGTYFYASLQEKQNKLQEIGVNVLKEGIIVGVTSALILKSDLPITTLFVETHSELPDSLAASKLIEVLDKYLDLKVDPGPLKESARKFEEKINKLLEKGKAVESNVEKKSMSYVG